jgi:hypothetical protein
VLLLLAALLAASEPSKPLEPRLPKLTSVFPQGAQPGVRLRAEVLGEFVDRAAAVVLLDPSIRGSIVESTYTHLTVDLEVAPEAPLGEHYFRVVTPRGASNVVLFRVGDQPHVMEKEPNSTFAEAQPVTPPVTLNGRLNVDGQSWIFDLRAARNGNGLDAALILLDARGRKLDHSEDVFIWDPFFSYTFSETSDYYAVVQPTHRQNDPNFAYQLDIRTAPYLETISPLSIQPGATVEATIFGTGLTGAGKLWFEAPGFSGDVLEMRGSTARVKITCPGDAREGPTHLAIATAGGRSNPATLLVDATPVYTGSGQIQPPVSINGVARYRQPERFTFDAKAGQTLVFEVRAQRFGSPVDSLLRILDTLGNQIAANDDADFAGAQFNKDSRITHTFKESDRFILEMRNLWKTTGEDFAYQLLVSPPRPRFELELGSDHPYLYPGVPGSIKLKVARLDGFKEPIRVEVSGLPAGVTAKPIEVPEGKDEAEIPLDSAADIKPGTYGNFRVTAVGAAKPAWQSVKVSSGGGEGQTFATVDQGTLAVIEKPLFSLEAAVDTMHLVRGGTAEFQVAISRDEGFSEPVHFSFEKLPPGVVAQQAVAPADRANVTIRLTAEKETAPGRFSHAAILGRSGSGQVQQAPHITIVVD